MTGSRILHLTDDTFDEEIKRVKGPLLVDFWADWCAPCKTIGPAIDELAEEMAGRAIMAKVDVASNGDLTNRFGIRHIPTLVVFKDGRVVDQMIGAAQKDQIRRLVERHL